VRRLAVLAAVTLSAGLAGMPPLWADSASSGRPNAFEATTSSAARRDAVQSIPFDKLDAQAAAKINGVLANVSVFRRMPVRAVNCDPEMYLFLVRHPDVVVNIWEVLKLSQLQLRQIGPDTFHVVEPDGSQTTFEYLYRGRDMHLIYAEGSYTGPLLPSPIKGRCLLILKSGYARETDGRYYISSRLDAFVNVDRGGAELLTKTMHALMGKIVDANFVQSVGFLGSLSHTAEVNSRGVQRLAGKLTHVQPEIRQQLADLAGAVAERSAANAISQAAETPLVASRKDADGKQ
jgi:hypothetical protein